MECRHFGECGSCRNFEGGYPLQLEKKVSRITEAFAPLYGGGLDVFASPDRHYRARAEFKIWHVGDAIHYAMNHIDGKGVVLIEECPKVVEPIAQMMPRLLEAIASVDMGFKLFGADFLATSEGEIAVSLLYHRKLDAEWESKAKTVADRH